MSEIEQVTTTLLSKGIPVLGKIIQNPSTAHGYFAQVQLTRSPDGTKSPSGRALALARSSLLDLGYAIDFILIDEGSRNIEESLRASLLSSFPDNVRNSFFSPDENGPQAWIEFKKQPDTEVLPRLKEHLSKFAELFSLPGLSMTQFGEANTATKTEVLAILRQLAPADVSTLAGKLADQGFSIPSLDWVNRCLDSMRKSNLVLRRRDGCYVLTMEALRRLGTRKDRRSPDVRRLLALARRNL